MTNDLNEPRLCAGPDCGADISHTRRGTLFCSRSCRDKAAYADSDRHKAAVKRREERSPKLASVIRMEKRRWAKEKQQKVDHQRQWIASDDPMGFKAYEAARAHLTHEQRMEQTYEDIGRGALGGLVQEAFDALGIAFVVHLLPDGSLGYEDRSSWEDQLGILDEIRRAKHHPFWS